jgi:hypothetical protein
MAPTAGLRHANTVGGRLRICVASKLMRRAVTIGAPRRLENPIGPRSAVHAPPVRLDGLGVAALAGPETHLRRPRRRMAAVAALAVNAGLGMDALSDAPCRPAMALLASHWGELLRMGNLGDAGMTGGAGQAPVDRCLEGSFVREKRDRFSTDLLCQALVGVTAETFFVGGPCGCCLSLWRGWCARGCPG